MKIILASKSGVRKQILEKNKIICKVIPSNINEDEVKISLLANGATPTLVSKNLAELKANKVSLGKPDQLVLGADSVIDLNGELISKPKSRRSFEYIKKTQRQDHKLTSSVCISKNGSMIWNTTDSSSLKMKDLSLENLRAYQILVIRIICLWCLSN